MEIPIKKLKTRKTLGIDNLLLELFNDGKRPESQANSTNPENIERGLQHSPNLTYSKERYHVCSTEAKTKLDSEVE